MYELRYPQTELLPYIENYWFVYPREDEQIQLKVDVYVDVRCDLVFNFGSPYTRSTSNEKPEQIEFSNVDTQRDKPITIQQSGNAVVAGVRFHAGGLAAFTPLKLSELNNQILPIITVFGDSVQSIERGLKNSVAALDQQKTILDQFFLSILNMDGPFKQFWSIKEHIESSDGLLPIDDICTDHGISIRSVDRLFSRCLGFSPKFYARVIRFQKALRKLMNDPGTTLADVSAECGYYDQPHFIREFKLFTGGLPRGYVGYYPETGPDDFAPNVVQFIQDE